MLVCLMTTIVASAAEWTPFETGVKYDFKFMEDQNFKFVPTEDGILRIYAQETNISVSTDETTAGDKISAWKYVPTTDEDGTSWSGYTEASLKAGTPYYINVPGTLSKSTTKYFKGVFEAGVNELKLTAINFEEGKTFDISDTRGGQLNLSFNMNAKSEETNVKIGNIIDCNVETRTSTNAGSLYVLLKDSLISWLNKGKIVGGEEMIITIKNIRAAADENIKYGKDGNLTLKFLTPSKPHTLVSKQLPDPFLSYWPKGDERGMIVLTFDSDVMAGDAQTAKGSFTLGYAEMDDVYVESLEPSMFRAEGNKLYIDFTGKLRTKETMGLKNDWDIITLRLMNVKMADGTNVFSAGAGTSGSFTFTMKYKEYKSNLAFELTPADGEKLTENTVKIYFSDKNAITFEGVKFTYQDENDKKYQTVVTEGITSTEEGDEAIEYVIPITDAIKNGKNVRFTLTGVVANDGLDHSDITARWNPGQELVATLTPSRAYMNESVKEVDVVKNYYRHVLEFNEDITINENATAADVTYKDTKSGRIIYGFVKSVNNNSKQVIVIPAEDLKDKHEYELTINERVIVNKEFVETNGKYGNVMPEQSYKFTIYANKDAYDFMTSPVEGSTVHEISTIVCSMKPGSEAGTSAIGYAHRTDKFVYLLNEKNEKVATATCGDVENGMFISFSPAITEPGTYTVHIEDSVYFVGTGYDALQNEKPVEFKYTIAEAPKVLEFTTDPVNESTVQEIGEIVIMSDKEIYGTTTPVNAYCDRMVFNGKLTFGDINRKEAYISFINEAGEPLTTEGEYRIEIPAGVFGDKAWYDSDGLSGACNAATTLYFTVGKEATEIACTADPADGSKVDALGTITLTYKTSEIGIGNGKIQINKDGNELTTVEAELDFNDYNVATVAVNATEKGVYTIEIPEGYFNDENGDPIPAVTLTYYVGDVVVPDNKPCTADPADGSELDALTTITLTYKNKEIGIGNGKIQINKDGNELTTVEAELDFNDYNVATVAVNATEKGVYTIEIPEGYFNDENGDPIPAVTLTYYVGVASGIQNINAAIANGTVYNLNGVKVNKATKGIFIVNGKKVAKK